MENYFWVVWKIFQYCYIITLEYKFYHGFRVDLKFCIGISEFYLWIQKVHRCLRKFSHASILQWNRSDVEFIDAELSESASTNRYFGLFFFYELSFAIIIFDYSENSVIFRKKLHKRHQSSHIFHCNMPNSVKGSWSNSIEDSNGHSCTVTPDRNDELRVIWDIFTRLNLNLLDWLNSTALVYTQMYLF